MPYFTHQGLSLHYEIHGTGTPVVLLHGATVSFNFNYGINGWIKRLNDLGFQVIGMDFRGHGQSDKPHDVESYGTTNLARDVLALLDHLGLDQAALVGYSIGTVVSLHLLGEHSERFTKAALVATGDGLIGIPPHTFAQLMPMLAAVLARTEYPKDLPRYLAAYWNFVEQTAGDRLALHALASASYPALTPAQAVAIQTQVLVVSGEKDLILGVGPALADALGHATYLEVAGANHFSLAGDAGTQEAVGRFLAP